MMESIHISEERLQELANPGFVALSQEKLHLESCEACRAAMSGYRKMYYSLQPALEPVLSLDFADLVMAKLPAPKSEKSIGWYWIPGFLVACLAAFIGIGYIFPDLDGFNYFPKMISGVLAQLKILSGHSATTSTVIWATVAVAIPVIAVADRVLRKRSGKVML